MGELTNAFKKYPGDKYLPDKVFAKLDEPFVTSYLLMQLKLHPMSPLDAMLPNLKELRKLTFRRLKCIWCNS